MRKKRVAVAAAGIDIVSVIVTIMRVVGMDVMVVVAVTVALLVAVVALKSACLSFGCVAEVHSESPDFECRKNCFSKFYRSCERKEKIKIRNFWSKIFGIRKFRNIFLVFKKSIFDFLKFIK